MTAELETRIQTIHQRVTSRARLADLINRLGLYPELRGVVPVEVIVERMRRDIQLQLKGVEQSTGRSTTISFSVGYSGRSPHSVAEVTNTLAGFYVEENTSSRARQAAKTAEFLSGQLAEAKRVLDDQERQTSEFTLRHTDELPGQLQANLAAIERLNTQVRLNGEYQLRLMERRERLEQDQTAEGVASGRRRSRRPRRSSSGSVSSSRTCAPGSAISIQTSDAFAPKSPRSKNRSLVRNLPTPRRRRPAIRRRGRSPSKRATTSSDRSSSRRRRSAG